MTNTHLAVIGANQLHANFTMNDFSWNSSKEDVIVHNFERGWCKRMLLNSSSEADNLSLDLGYVTMANGSQSQLLNQPSPFITLAAPPLAVVSCPA